jgi:hypothetical protein
MFLFDVMTLSEKLLARLFYFAISNCWGALLLADGRCHGSTSE